MQIILSMDQFKTGMQNMILRNQALLLQTLLSKKVSSMKQHHSIANCKI